MKGDAEISNEVRGRRGGALHLWFFSVVSRDIFVLSHPWMKCPRPGTCQGRCSPSGQASEGRTSGQTPAECHRCELQRKIKNQSACVPTPAIRSWNSDLQRWLTHALLIQNVVWRFHVEESRRSFICLHAILCT